MPISNECIELLKKFTNDYSVDGHSDADYRAINPLLQKVWFIVLQEGQHYKDERVLSFLGISALLLEEGNPLFSQLCKEFIIEYNRQTHAVDSMLDDNQEIKKELGESWGETAPKNNSISAQSYSPFFIELQQAIALRNQRKAEQEALTKNSFSL